MNDIAADGALTPEQILEAAEDVLRRFGPSKATVVDVARALGVSHGSVYRHFPSKAALREAVLERWLHRISDPLEALVGDLFAGDFPGANPVREPLVSAGYPQPDRIQDLHAFTINSIADPGQAAPAKRLIQKG